MAEPTQQEITKVIAANDRATRGSDYVDALKMDAVMIEGTRYKFRLSEALPER